METEVYLALLAVTTTAVGRLWWKQSAMQKDFDTKQAQYNVELREAVQHHHECQIKIAELRGDAKVLKKAIQDLERLHFGDQLSATDITVSSDENSIITGWSMGATLLFGWSSQEVVGKSISQTIVPPPLRQEHDEAFSHIANSSRTEISHRIKNTRGLKKGGDEFVTDIEVKGRKSVLGGWQFTAKFLPEIVQQQSS